MQAAIVLLLLCRVWTDSTGKYSTDAEFIDSHADTAYLQAGDHVKAVSLSRLSLDDQEFVAAQQNIKLIVGKVTSVSYNDSIVVRDDEAHDVRLVGIATPKAQQAYGPESIHALTQKLLGNEVVVEWRSKDADGRVLGNVISDKHWINKEIVEEGWAWNHDGSAVLADAESKAREAKAGLWAGASSVAPWEFQSLSLSSVTKKASTKVNKVVGTEPPISSSDESTGVVASSTHSRSRSTSSESAKTVHVKSYVTKKGTVIESYNRRPP
ncbi:MAG TPA: thermonuclease family protein, partial [Lacipirellulaceae bacterium]